MQTLLGILVDLVLFNVGTWKVRVWHSCVLLAAIGLLAYHTR